jgi:hypothetical protein
METIIAGIYENGHVLLDRQPDSKVKARVKVIFEEITDTETPKKRQFGIGKGSIQMTEDFNDPLEDLKDYM